MWFIILTTRYESNPRAIAWSGSEKFMTVKINVLLLPNSLNTLEVKINQQEVNLQYWKTVMPIVSLTKTEQNN